MGSEQGKGWGQSRGRVRSAGMGIGELRQLQ